MINYLFDIDGTLTPHRQPMVKSFKSFFADWISKKRDQKDKVFLVTGSDKDKTIEQIGLPMWRFVDGSYQNCGNQLYRKGKLIKESQWRISAYLRLDILLLMEKSPFFGLAENNIEERSGMANISCIGRSATREQRETYYKYDKNCGERQKIIEHLSLSYPKLDFSIGGQISIDIYPRGKDKSQVLQDMVGKTMFFGDRCEGGNDHHISRKSDEYYNVNGWEETYEILNKML
jgi:phosphomannomutase